MSEDPKTTESGQEQASSELPIPKLESASVASPTSGTDTDALVKAVLEKISPEIDKRVQSVKDKRIAEIEKRLDSGQFAELEAMGAQIPENVKLEYRLRELEGKNAQLPKSQPASQGSGANLTAKDVSQVITDLQLDANDPQVIEALRGTYRNRDHFDAEMTKLAYRRATKQKPSPSAAPSGGAPSVPAAGSQDEIVAAYEKEIEAVPSGQAYIWQRSQIKSKYRKMAQEAGFRLNV